MIFPNTAQILNWSLTIASLILCILLPLVQLPGLELFGITPNWPLIWLVAWSMKRTVLQGAIAGLAVGLILDGMSISSPSHALAFVLVGILTVFLYRQVIKKVQEDFISVALIVFGMAVLVETVRAFQFSQLPENTLGEIWVDQQRVALSSAILSSLWAPVIYFPLNRWWALIEPSNKLKSKSKV